MPSAAILAGGRARRFDGRDKSALVVGGSPILERQLAALGAVAPPLVEVLLVGRPSEIRPVERPPLTVRVVADSRPGHGPLGGLETALTTAREDVLVVIACDMPFISADLLTHLLALSGAADAVVPVTERGYHPLCAVYTRACLATVTRHIDEGRLRMNALLDTVRVRVVGPEEMMAFGDPARLLANVNSQVEHDEIQAVTGHDAQS